MATMHKLLIAIQAVLFAAGSLSAAELRTSTGDRNVVRTVSYEQVDPAEAPSPPRRKTSARPASFSPPDPEPELAPGEFGEYCDACNSDWCGYSVQPLRCTFGSVEFLTWWRRGNSIPALVTTAPPGQNPNLGNSATSVLFGNEAIGQNARPGGRATIGVWLDHCERFGVEARFFSLGQGRATFNLDSNTNPVIGRPFFNTDPGVLAEDAFLVAFSDPAAPANNVTGAISIENTSDIFGGDALFRLMMCRDCGWRVDLLAGYQAARIDESLIIASDSLVGATPVLLQDSFATRNEFHGGVIGALVGYDSGCWRLDVLAKIGLGNMRETLTIDGDSTLIEPGGLLAKPSNIGVFTQDQFAVSPEIGLNLKYRVSCNLELLAGYSFIYWSEALTPGSQINLNVNPTQTDPPAAGDQPILQIQDGDYWVHGINLGLQWNY